MKKLKWYWCIHHRVIIEPAIEPIKNRRKYVKKHKPKYQQEMRFKCLKKVKGKIPEEIIEAGKVYVKAKEAYVKAGEAYDEAWEACYKVREACYKAEKAYDKTLKKYKKELIDMHAKECPDCKFDWDEGIIFKEE